MLFEARGMVQNLLMANRLVRNVASRFHSTGMNGHPARAAEAFERYAAEIDVRGKDVLELGPGQTPEVLELCAKAGARTCTGLDVQGYQQTSRASRTNVSLRLYDGKSFPLPASSLDAVISSDVLEHVRYPALTVAEMSRVLRPGGLVVCRVDLRDHYYLDKEERWLECLKYPDFIWRAIAWNRSSYVNRIRYSGWHSLFNIHGFVLRTETALRSTKLLRLHERGRISSAVPLRSEADLAVYRFDAVFVKAERITCT